MAAEVNWRKGTRKESQEDFPEKKCVWHSILEVPLSAKHYNARHRHLKALEYLG